MWNNQGYEKLRRAWSRAWNHGNTYVHTCIHNQEVTELLHFISEPFVELRSEANECIACYMGWNRVPKVCTCEGEAGYKQMCSKFWQCHGSWIATVVTNKKIFEILGCQRERVRGWWGVRIWRADWLTGWLSDWALSHGKETSTNAQSTSNRTFRLTGIFSRSFVRAFELARVFTCVLFVWCLP